MGTWAGSARLLPLVPLASLKHEGRPKDTVEQRFEVSSPQILPGDAKGVQEEGVWLLQWPLWMDMCRVVHVHHHVCGVRGGFPFQTRCLPAVPLHTLHLQASIILSEKGISDGVRLIEGIT